MKKFGVRPDQLADFLALAGDRGNNIPGVPGVGAKTAAGLLGRFATLEEALLSAGAMEGKLGERLREHAEAARLCRRLVGLRTDLELGTNLSELRYVPGPARNSQPDPLRRAVSAASADLTQAAARRASTEQERPQSET